MIAQYDIESRRADFMNMTRLLWKVSFKIWRCQLMLLVPLLGKNVYLLMSFEIRRNTIIANDGRGNIGYTNIHLKCKFIIRLFVKKI